MRKYICLLLSLALLLAGCSVGRDEARITVGESETYSKREILSAMDKVRAHFVKYFDDCTLTDLWYDEALCLKEADQRAEQYDAEEAIILLSNFDTGSDTDGSLNPGDTYQNWMWILVHRWYGWELVDWGY